MIFLLFFSGILIGAISGLLGVGGGIIIVPLLVFLGSSPVHAVGTSVLSILIITLSASFHNWRQGDLEYRRLALMSIPCIFSTQIGVFLATEISSFWLLFLFGLFLLLSVFLIKWRTRLQNFSPAPAKDPPISLRDIFSLIWVGGLGGFFSGMFGVGGGAILVPLQVLILEYPLKVAVRTSLGVVMISALFSSVGHYFAGNIIFYQAIPIGIGGLIGAQAGARLLPKLKDQSITHYFVFVLLALAIYVFWKAFS